MDLVKHVPSVVILYFEIIFPFVIAIVYVLLVVKKSNYGFYFIF